MSNEIEDMNQEQEEISVTRLQSLKMKADRMGITYSNNISEETLAKRIEDKLNGVSVTRTSELNPLAGDIAGETPVSTLTLRQQMLRDQMKLIRCRITNMDPKKKDLPGEVLTVANEILGTVRKFIPYGEATDDGYHIPQCLLTMLQERKFLNIRTVKDRRTGVTRPDSSWVREFSIEILPPLTEQELKRLATAQIAAGTSSTSDDE